MSGTLGTEIKHQLSQGVLTANAAGPLFLRVRRKKEGVCMLKWSRFPKILTNAAISTSSVTLLLAMAGLFGWVMAFDPIPQKISWTTS